MLVLPKFSKILWCARFFWENVLDSYSCLYIEISYSNLTFCGAYTFSFVAGHTTSTKRAHPSEKCDVDKNVCVQLKSNHTKCGRKRTITGRPFCILNFHNYSIYLQGMSQSVLEMITKLFDQACNFSPLDILLLLLLSKIGDTFGILAINHVSNSFNILLWVFVKVTLLAMTFVVKIS